MAALLFKAGLLHEAAPFWLAACSTSTRHAAFVRVYPVHSNCHFFAIALIWSLHLLAVREGKKPHPQWTLRDRSKKSRPFFLFFLKCRLLFGSFKHQTRYSSVALFKTVARWTIVQAGRLRAIDLRNCSSKTHETQQLLSHLPQDPNPGRGRLANLSSCALH